MLEVPTDVVLKETRLKRTPYEQVQCSLLPLSLSRPIPSALLGTATDPNGRKKGRNDPDVHPKPYRDLDDASGHGDDVASM